MGGGKLRFHDERGADVRLGEGFFVHAVGTGIDKSGEAGPEFRDFRERRIFDKLFLDRVLHDTRGMAGQENPAVRGEPDGGERSGRSRLVLPGKRAKSGNVPALFRDPPVRARSFAGGGGQQRCR